MVDSTEFKITKERQATIAGDLHRILGGMEQETQSGLAEFVHDLLIGNRSLQFKIHEDDEVRTTQSGIMNLICGNALLTIVTDYLERYGEDQ